MSLSERIERLEERERRLLGVLAVVIFVLIVLLIPLGVTAALRGNRSSNEELRAAITELADGREAVERSRALRLVVDQRYANPAPPLAPFLAKLAAQVELEIPETQDRQPVPHGKRYEEKATKLSLRRVGMYKIARFLESIEQSGHPVSIGQLTVRKRGVEPDSYDVDMVVSAFERKPDKVPPKTTSTEAQVPGAP